MKNFAITLLTLALTSVFTITNINAQDWQNIGQYLAPVNDKKIFLGNYGPYVGENNNYFTNEEQGKYRMKILELDDGSDCSEGFGGIFTYTQSRPGFRATSFDASAIYAQTHGTVPAIQGILRNSADDPLPTYDANGCWNEGPNNIQAGVFGASYATGVYGYGDQIGGWFSSNGIGLYATSTNGPAAQFDGDVKVENGNVKVEDGHVAIGDAMNFTGGLDALLQVKTSDAHTFGIRAESSETVAVGGISTNASGVGGVSVNGRGVNGYSRENIGVDGTSLNGIGVRGESENDIAIYGEALNGAAVKGVSGYSHGGYFETVDGAAALYALDRDGGSLAAHFEGNVKLNGAITGNVHAGGVRIETPQGYYTEIGPFNEWNSHFRTNRSQFYFYQKIRSAGAMYATGFHVTSDKRLKKDVSEFQYGLDEVLQLNPLTYDYTEKGGTTSGDYNVGLFAQDLQKVAPEFVTEFTHRDMDEAGDVKNEKDYLQVYDTGIKYMLINATKEQQEIIDNQAAKIETLEETLAELKATVAALVDSQTDEINRQNIRLQDNTSSLEQNQPNPFSTNTLIKYNLPKDTNNAVITIYNTTGQVMHQEHITQAGTGEIQLQADSLNAGTYSYTLTIDGRIVDTKQMVVTK